MDFFTGSPGAIVSEAISVGLLFAGWFVFSIAPAFVFVYLTCLMISGGVQNFIDFIMVSTREFIEFIIFMIISVIFFIIGYNLLGIQGVLIGGAIGAVLAGMLVVRLLKYGN